MPPCPAPIATKLVWVDVQTKSCLSISRTGIAWHVTRIRTRESLTSKCRGNARTEHPLGARLATR